MTVITLTAGTAFIMWLGEQITEKGIGNGISLIIFAGIGLQGSCSDLSDVYIALRGRDGHFLYHNTRVMMIAVIGVIVFVESGQRRNTGTVCEACCRTKDVRGQTTHLPLKVNTAGVIPPIFASSIIMFPATIAQLHISPMDEADFRRFEFPGKWFMN